MSRVVVCTIVRGRRQHLRNLLVGLARQSTAPDRVVVAVMGGPDVTRAADGLGLPLTWVDAASATSDLPLAAARNTARKAAPDATRLIFLDVDIIPSRGLVADYVACLKTTDAVWSGHVDYLPPGAPKDDLDESDLAAVGQPHPARPRPTAPGRLSRPELFWSLSFALSAASFDRVAGFDPAFTGYGAEDTDFALRVAAAQIPLLQTPSAAGWHQHHDSVTPPVNHLLDIVANAHTFRQRWGRWPMEGWLTEFEARGCVRWTPSGHLLQVTDSGMAACRGVEPPRTPSGVGR